MRNSRLEILRRITAFLLIFFIVGSVPGLSGCSSKKAGNSGAAASVSAQTDMASFAYDGKPYVVINDNDPDFTDADMTTTSFESYGELDGLGRCTTAFANIGKDLMPAEKRGSIGEVKPTGWQTAKYDNVDGKYLYNRCHLIGYQLTGENANAKNLITGTRYLNVDGMLPFENMVADYIKETNNHVLYRVTPVFFGDNLVASGVHIEAESVEDNGDGILFNVYCFNAQPGIAIDYATGDSHQDDSIVADASKSTTAAEANVQTYVLNTNTKKFHKESCNSARSMDASNKKIYTGSRQEIIDMGYEACGVCKP
ncbi:MAG: DNA/RNA non-specific endonuclease [Lachnospira sp.]|nr:DNA/RNA non-specific endonuclease [Lachnospira sp.]